MDMTTAPEAAKLRGVKGFLPFRLFVAWIPIIAPETDKGTV